jgi:hypothetical protein
LQCYALLSLRWSYVCGMLRSTIGGCLACGCRLHVCGRRLCLDRHMIGCVLVLGITRVLAPLLGVLCLPSCWGGVTCGQMLTKPSFNLGVVAFFCAPWRRVLTAACWAGVKAHEGILCVQFWATEITGKYWPQTLHR